MWLRGGFMDVSTERPWETTVLAILHSLGKSQLFWFITGFYLSTSHFSSNNTLEKPPGTVQRTAQWHGMMEDSEPRLGARVGLVRG